VCVCVCVREREREREPMRQYHGLKGEINGKRPSSCNFRLCDQHVCCSVHVCFFFQFYCF